jgi:hypothetical protein
MIRTVATTAAVRVSLGLSVPFNLLAAYAFALPDSALGTLIGMPADVPQLYALTLAFLIGQFGCTYAWLAAQACPHRPLVAFSAIGKSGVFLIVLLLWLSGAASGRLVLIACGDLLLALLWLRWLLV